MRPADLRPLLEAAIVQIRHRNDQFVGVGFVVAPEIVATNHHVWRDTEFAAVVVNNGVSFATTSLSPGDGLRYRAPDLTFLHVAGLSVEPVLLGEPDHSPAAATRRRDVSVVCIALTRVAGNTSRGAKPKWYDFQVTGMGSRDANVTGRHPIIRGMSGSPILSEDGVVCGIVAASAVVPGAAGGTAIPNGGIFIPVGAEWPAEFLAQNAEAHPYGSSWRRAATRTSWFQDALFGAPRRTPTGELSPASLLVAANRVVEFEDRPELADLAAWCRRDTRGDVVRLVHGEAGSGKTRMALELCRTMRHEGWLAGFISSSDDLRQPWPRRLTEAFARGLRVLIVVDYAEHKLPLLGHLLRLLARAQPDRVRVLLLARAERPWWAQWSQGGHGLDSADADWALSGARVRHLPPITSGVDATGLAARAFAAYARRLGVDLEVPPRPLVVDDCPTMLDVHARAVDAAYRLVHRQADPDEYPVDPLEAVSRHEHHFWVTRLTAGKRIVPTEIGRRPAVTGAALLAPSLAANASVEALGPVLQTALAAVAGPRPRLDGGAIATGLWELYPAPQQRHRTVLPVTPDRVAEALCRMVTVWVANPDDMGRFLVACLRLDASPDGRDAEPGLIVLARARGCTATGRLDHHPAYALLDDALAEVAQRHPGELLPPLLRVAGTLPSATPMVDVAVCAIAHAEAEQLCGAEEFLPLHPGALAPASVKLFGRLVELPPTTDDFKSGRRFARLRRLSLALNVVGSHEAALAYNQQAIDEAVDWSRRSGTSTRAILARLRYDRAQMLHQAGASHLSAAESRSRFGAAIASGEAAMAEVLSPRPRTSEAVHEIVLDLLEGRRSVPGNAADAHLLADVVNLLGVAYAQDSRPDQAIAASRLAARLYQDLRFDEGTARATHNLSEQLAGYGDLRSARDVDAVAIEIYHDLYEAQPSRYSHDYARALVVSATLWAVPETGEDLNLAASLLRRVPTVFDFMPTPDPGLARIYREIVKRVLRSLTALDLRRELEAALRAAEMESHGRPTRSAGTAA